MIRPSRSRFVHRVEIQTMNTEQRDSARGLDPSPRTIAESVACLVSDKGGSRQVGYAGELARKHVRVLFPDPISLDLGHRLIFGSRTLVVDSFRNDYDLGRLWVAECQEEPQPSISGS